MIKNLRLNNIATYTQKTTIFPNKINYFYGGNGSGKTTLSKVIDDESKFSDCSIDWEQDEIATLVYNKDFINNHFSQIKGIFTLGKDATEAESFLFVYETYIEKTKNIIENCKEKLIRAESSLQKIRNEQTKKTNAIENKCWEIKLKYEKDFREAYTGFIGSKKSFFDKCINEKRNNTTLGFQLKVGQNTTGIYHFMP